MNVMPRWRTRIDPAVTAWPSPTFTPRRWPTLSRPFLELEPAFLCAIGLPTLPSLVARHGDPTACRRPWAKRLTSGHVRGWDWRPDPRPWQEPRRGPERAWGGGGRARGCPGGGAAPAGA